MFPGLLYPASFSSRFTCGIYLQVNILVSVETCSVKYTVLHEGPILILDKSAERGVGGRLGSLPKSHPRGGPAHMPSGIPGVGEPSLVGERFPLPGSPGRAAEGMGWRPRGS